MTRIWKSAKKEETDKTFSGAMPSSWSRQQKLVMGASFVILGLLLAVVACSTQSSKPAVAGASGPAPNSSTAPTPTEVAATAAQPIPDAPVKSKKKVQKKRPANVVYSDPNSGVSFLYPRKFALASGNDAQPHFGNTDTIPMNFVHSGGLTVAMVAVPNSLYPKTDFASALFTVNVNRNLSEQECSHFAFVDTNDADGEPIDAHKVKVGSVDMEMTEELTGSATHQLETAYYHHYENAACYEYVLGLATDGYSPQSGIQPINRDAVFARLEKILATVKTMPTMKEPEAKQPAAEPTVAGQPHRPTRRPIDLELTRRPRRGFPGGLPRLVGLLRFARHRKPEYNPQLQTNGGTVTQKIIEVVGTSTESFAKASEAAVKEAAKTVRNMKWAHIDSLDMMLEGGKVVQYRATTKIYFDVEG